MKRTLTVADMVAELKKLPQDMKVFVYCDEMGAYWPATEPQCRIDAIKHKHGRRRGNWTWNSHPRKNSKRVCVLHEEWSLD